LSEVVVGEVRHGGSDGSFIMGVDVAVVFGGRLTESLKCRLILPPKGWKLESVPSLLGTGDPREGDPGSGFVRGIVDTWFASFRFVWQRFRSL
jgi:hypothetical protein